MEKNEVFTSESVDGSRDVWSSKSSDSSSADHLVVMVNGILGNATDWKFASEQFVKELPDKVFVHCSERNVSTLTLDGVDIMGERLAEEVLEVIHRKPNMRRISFIAHSVGGLVARYAIGRLYRPPEKEPVQDLINKGKVDSIGTICGLEATNFITVATPHLGSRGNKQVPFLFGVTAFEKVARYVIHWIFRRTGTLFPLKALHVFQITVILCAGLHCALSNAGFYIQMCAMTILLAGEHHLLDVIMNFQRGAGNRFVSCVMGKSRC